MRQKRQDGAEVALSAIALQLGGGDPAYGVIGKALAPSGVRVNTISPGPIYVDGGATKRVQY